MSKPTVGYGSMGSGTSPPWAGKENDRLFRNGQPFRPTASSSSHGPSNAVPGASEKPPLNISGAATRHLTDREVVGTKATGAAHIRQREEDARKRSSSATSNPLTVEGGSEPTFLKYAQGSGNTNVPASKTTSKDIKGKGNAANQVIDIEDDTDEISDSDTDEDAPVVASSGASRGGRMTSGSVNKANGTGAIPFGIAAKGKERFETKSGGTKIHPEPPRHGPNDSPDSFCNDAAQTSPKQKKPGRVSSMKSKSDTSSVAGRGPRNLKDAAVVLPLSRVLTIQGEYRDKDKDFQLCVNTNAAQVFFSIVGMCVSPRGNRGDAPNLTNTTIAADHISKITLPRKVTSNITYIHLKINADSGSGLSNEPKSDFCEQQSFTPSLVIVANTFLAKTYSKFMAAMRIGLKGSSKPSISGSRT